MSDFLSQILVYDDADCIVVQKPSGLLSVPGKGDLTDSVLTRLVACDPRILLIHRLDRDTSGLMVFARTKHAQREISRQFEQRQTEKQYQALVLGELVGQGEINVPVRYDPTRPPMHIADPDYPKHALTHWQAQPTRQQDGHTITPVLLQPITGRSHQLRVHLQSIGHPILGDLLYADALGVSLLPRLALHAQRLTFQHPVTAQTICIENNADFW